MRANVVAWLAQYMPHHIASLIAPSWFTMVGLAGVVTLLVMMRLARRHGIDRGTVASIVLWTYVGAVAAGIVVPMAIDLVQQKLGGGHVQLRWAGMTSFWGYLAGSAAIVIICREHEIPLARFADICTAPLGLTLFMARLGCFFAGCDFGKVSSAPWAMRFPKGSPAWHAHVDAGLLPASRAESLPVHPTQLYEALLGLIIAAVALWAMRQAWARAPRVMDPSGAGRPQPKDGRVIVVGIVIYAIGRIVVETFRGDVGRGIYGGVSSGQIFSICVLAAVALSLVRKQIARVVVVASMFVLFVGSAHAQPAPQQPQPPQPQQPQQQPQQYPQPYPSQPYPPPQYPQYPQYPPPQAYPPPQPQQAPGEPEGPRRNHLEVGLLTGFAAPMNRRQDQVPALAGISVSAGYVFGPMGIWLDFDSLANSEATHGTWLLSGSFVGSVRDGLTFGGRFGVGTTLVNFHQQAFDDVQGTNIRFEATAEYAVGESWALWARPLSIDILTASELGGPITTLQMRIGLAYTFGASRHSRVASVQPMPPQYPQQPQYPPPAPAPSQPAPQTSQARIP